MNITQTLKMHPRFAAIRVEPLDVQKRISKAEVARLKKLLVDKGNRKGIIWDNYNGSSLMLLRRGVQALDRKYDVLVTPSLQDGTPLIAVLWKLVEKGVSDVADKIKPLHVSSYNPADPPPFLEHKLINGLQGFLLQSIPTLMEEIRPEQ